ncbi:MAG: sodium:alanine symporter family protein [Butyricicoccus pullicaecorum]|nr:sodium:alanine symporter family protein [Butyricicoccus pullicaecorum]
MEWILKIRYTLWGPFTVLFIAATGVLLTLRTHGVQFWCVKHLLRCRSNQKADGISPFEALCTSLGGTLGVGNLAGVASALTLGGPGAIFWMLVAAFLGMATKYSELLLAVKYREHRPEPLGGPMVYLSRGAHLPALAHLFAFCCIFSAIGTSAAAQGSAITEALAPLVQIPRPLIALIVCLLLLPVLYGGSALIAQVSSVLVPLMTGSYLLIGGLVVALHADQIPSALSAIVSGALEPLACGGGLLGVITAHTISDGFSKGIFSNEAGMGSAPIAHGSSDSNSPCETGMLGAVEVFVDTCVVCLLTALVLLTTGAWQSGTDGLAMTIYAFATVLGDFAPWFIGITVVFLAVSTILGWSFYGLSCLKWLHVQSWFLRIYPLLIVCSAALSGYLPLTPLLLVTDISAACMSFPNLIGLWTLSGEVSKETRQFLQKTKSSV